jgi:hypothetical protein
MGYHINRVIVLELEAALKSAKGAYDPGRSSYVFPYNDADRQQNAMIHEAIRLYVQTWIEGPLDRALKLIKGEELPREWR